MPSLMLTEALRSFPIRPETLPPLRQALVQAVQADIQAGLCQTTPRPCQV